MSRWDILVAQSTDNSWEAVAQCPKCGYMKHMIWAGYYPDVPPNIARADATNRANSVRVARYCEWCGAKLDGGEGDDD